MRCEECRGERLAGICLGCLAYSWVPVEEDLKRAIEDNEEEFTVYVSHAIDILNALQAFRTALEAPNYDAEEGYAVGVDPR